MSEEMKEAVQMVLRLVLQFGLTSGDTRVVLYFEGHHFAFSNSFSRRSVFYLHYLKSFHAIPWKTTLLH